MPMMRRKGYKCGTRYRDRPRRGNSTGHARRQGCDILHQRSSASSGRSARRRYGSLGELSKAPPSSLGAAAGGLTQPSPHFAQRHDGDAEGFGAIFSRQGGALDRGHRIGGSSVVSQLDTCGLMHATAHAWQGPMSAGAPCLSGVETWCTRLRTQAVQVRAFAAPVRVLDDIAQMVERLDFHPSRTTSKGPPNSSATDLRQHAANLFSASLTSADPWRSELVAGVAQV